MKKRILLFYLLFSLQSMYAVQKTWIGSGGNKLWDNVNNWMPNGVPATADDVVINISDSINVNQAVTINSLHIKANATVVLAAVGPSRTIKVTSTSLVQLGLLIEMNCTLFIQGVVPSTSTISLVLDMTTGLGVTGEIYGDLIFRKVGAGSGTTNCHLDTHNDASNYGKLLVKNGGVVKYEPNTDNTEASGAPLNTISFEDGATFWVNKNGGSFPAGLYAANSLIKKTGDCSSTTGFNNNAYGNLEWNCPNQTTIQFLNKDLSFNGVEIIHTGTGRFVVKTGSSVGLDTMRINNLNVYATGTVTISNSNVTATNGGTLIVTGNIVNNGIINSLGAVAATHLCSLEGTGNQNISGSGSFGPNLDFKINKLSGAVNLLNDISINGRQLRLTQGIINTGVYTLNLHDSIQILSSASGLYTHLNTAAYSNFGNEFSFINGKLRINGLNASTKKAFPVGSVSFHRPIFLNNATGDFTVQYFAASPRISFGTSYSTGIDHISDVEYWVIDGTNSPQANVELTYFDPNSGGVTDMNDLRVSRYDGSNWTNAGNLSYVGNPGSNGSVSSNLVSNFSPFTLASSSTNNPLPEYNLILSGIVHNGKANLMWTANSPVTSFVLEKSYNSIDFVSFTPDLPFSLNSFTSNDLTCFYRIRANLNSGFSIYSNVLKLKENKLNVRIFPNPSFNQIKVLLSNTSGHLRIFNTQQQLVFYKKTSSENEIINIRNFKAGIYLIQYIDEKQNNWSSQFVKK